MEIKMKNSEIEWIGNIPETWDSSSLRRLILGRDGGAWGEEANSPDEGTVCLRVADFDFDRGCFKSTSEDNLTKRKYASYQIAKLQLQIGDILIEKSGGGEKAPVGRAVLFDKNYKAVYANFMDRLRFDGNRIRPRFAEYWLRGWYNCRCSPYYINQTIGIQNINLSLMLAKEKVFFPSTEEQDRIIKYLDDACSEIDTLSADIQSEIETLEAYKRSIITEAVTKGLDHSVRMKDSGVDWIGQVPEEWTKCKVKHACSYIGSGTTPNSSVLEYYDNGDIKWIQSGDLYKKAVVNNTEKTVTKLAVRALSALKVYTAPFVVMAMYGASVGNTAISMIDACTNQACCCLMPKEGTNIGYMYYWLEFCKQDFLGKAEGGGQPNISQGKIKNEIMFLPKEDEQKQIAKFLDKKCSQIDSISDMKRKQLETLLEYKKSLIYEYITGKKGVPQQ